MATDSIVGGLFGMNPQAYEAGQQALADQQAMQYAQLNPYQQATFSAFSGGRQLGRGIGGLMGVEDPQLKQITAFNQLASQFDTGTSGGMAGFANALRDQGLIRPALQYGQKAAEMRKLEAEAQAKTMERLTNEQKNAAGIADASGAIRGTPEWSEAYRTELARLTTKQDAAGSEFERTLKSLNLPPDKEKALKEQRLAAMLNNDPNGIKAITAQLASLQLEQRQFKFDEEKKASEAAKQTAITKLAGLENDIDESLITAAKAIKLAPNGFYGAASQDVASVIPWTDQRSLKNLVSSLNSDKAIGTLQELKTQSKTGATGFGALNTKELQLILDKTRSLDPADKMFKENLTTVMKGWQRVRESAIASRENLQAKPASSTLAANPEAWIKLNMEKNPAYSREDVIRQGIEARRLPSNYGK